jgi:TonB family protein
MNKNRFISFPIRLPRMRTRLISLAALALMAMTLIPAGAADQRAVKTRFAPTYPEIAKRMRISGEVRMAVTVDADGKVTSVKTISGNRMLSSAAEEAVRKWKFEPGPGVSSVEVSLNFALAQ